MLFKDIKDAFYDGTKIRRKGWPYYWVWQGSIYKVTGNVWFDMNNTAYKRDMIDDICCDDWETVK